MMFQKKRFFKNKKIRVQFLIVDFPAKPAKQKKLVALKKSRRRETKHLSTDADSSTDAIGGWTKAKSAKKKKK